MTPLHQGVVMGIFKCHFIPAICCRVQSIEIAISQPTLTEEGNSMNENTQSLFVTPDLEFYAYKLTQFMLRKLKKRIVLIQILVKLYGEFAYKLGSSFYFLGREKQQRVGGEMQPNNHTSEYKAGTRYHFKNDQLLTQLGKHSDSLNTD